jgi:hypothetical protein
MMRKVQELSTNLSTTNANRAGTAEMHPPESRAVLN